MSILRTQLIFTTFPHPRRVELPSEALAERAGNLIKTRIERNVVKINMA
ncbi:MAG: hypothetical protein Q4F56_02240 [Candidatus Saccharibacteria bacterium]|nr:hypothetical protein [Candidatus Saccharibacteria bacterium]